jgi:hypothetical protein
VQLIIYEPVGADPKVFVDFWAARYTGYDDDFYYANVGQELTQARILDLFEWKNGRRLSEEKRDSVLRNFVARRGELDQIGQDEAAAALLSRFSEGGPILKDLLASLLAACAVSDIRPACPPRDAIHTGGSAGRNP